MLMVMSFSFACDDYFFHIRILKNWVSAFVLAAQRHASWKPDGIDHTTGAYVLPSLEQLLRFCFAFSKVTFNAFTNPFHSHSFTCSPSSLLHPSLLLINGRSSLTLSQALIDILCAVSSVLFFCPSLLSSLLRARAFHSPPPRSPSVPFSCSIHSPPWSFSTSTSLINHNHRILLQRIVCVLFVVPPHRFSHYYASTPA